MKKNLLLAGMLCISAIAFGQTTVDMATGNAGKLATKIAEADRATLTDLTIKGEINAVDFKLIRDQLPALTKLNIEETTIVAYIGGDGTYTYGDEYTEYEANHIPSQAFYSVETLTDIVFPKSITDIDYLAISRTKIKVLDFSQTTLAKVDGSGLSANTELTTISFPSTLLWLSESVLEYCTSLTSFTCLVTDPANITDGVYGMFGIRYQYDEEKGGYVTDENGEYVVESIEGAPAGCTLYVPVGSVDKYKNAETWKTFTSIKEIGSVEKQDPSVSFTDATVTKKDTDAKFTNTLINPDGVEVAYSSSDESVATVDASTGEVTILKDGTTTITATTVETEAYNSIQVSYVLTVEKGSGIDHVASSTTIEMTGEGIQLQFEGTANIEVYTVNGIMVEKTTATDNCHITLDKGLYLVKVNNNLHKVVR